MPFVKGMLLRDNVGDVRLDPVYRAMSGAGYNLGLVAFDRPPPPRARKVRERLRKLWSHIAHYSEGTSPIAEISLAAETAPVSAVRNSSHPMPAEEQLRRTGIV
jgi:hypothetical protein